MRKLNLAFILFVTLLASFASMSYELMIARFLTSLTSDSVLSQSVTIGTYLLALGLGAHFCSKVEFKNPFKTFIVVESILAICTAVLMHFILWLHLYIEGLDPAAGWSKARILVFSAQGVTLIVGFLSGFEIPLLIAAAKDYSKKAFGVVLGVSYIGGLISSVLIVLIVMPRIGLLSTSLFVSLLTSAIAIVVLLRYEVMRPQFTYVLLVPALIMPPYLSKIEPAIQQFYLKSYYYIAPATWSLETVRSIMEAHRTQPDIRRITTPYQEIDLVYDDYQNFKTQDFNMFIDHKNQFGTASERVYHDLMIHGAINLSSHQPKRALIIGGGDGLLVRELLKYDSLQTVTVVELDPVMIKVAMTFPPLVRLNRNALKDSRVRIATGDGFEWIRKNRETFDSIFIDLPHPHSVELSRLYSVEFYRFVQRRLSDDGFMIFDFPFYAILKDSSRDRNAVRDAAAVLKSVKEAGFTSYKLFGFYESFAIATKNQRTLDFKYEKFGDLIAPMTTSQMAFINDELLSSLQQEANSIFKPRWLRYGFDGN